MKYFTRPVGSLAVHAVYCVHFNNLMSKLVPTALRRAGQWPSILHNNSRCDRTSGKIPEGRYDKRAPGFGGVFTGVVLASSAVSKHKWFHFSKGTITTIWWYLKAKQKEEKMNIRIRKWKFKVNTSQMLGRSTLFNWLIPHYPQIWVREVKDISSPFYVVIYSWEHVIFVELLQRCLLYVVFSYLACLFCFSLKFMFPFVDIYILKYSNVSFQFLQM